MKTCEVLCPQFAPNSLIVHKVRNISKTKIGEMNGTHLSVYLTVFETVKQKKPTASDLLICECVSI
jgi:hypothetical protein